MLKMIITSFPLALLFLLALKRMRARCGITDASVLKMRYCIDSQDSIKSGLYYSIFLLQHIQCMHKTCLQEHIKETTIIQVEYLVYVKAGT